MKVLWLASWYPDAYEPANGDFIQRHAKAVAALMPLDVIHVVQAGKDAPVKDEFIEAIDGNLREFIYGFSFSRSGISLLDKIRYNLEYQQFYLQILEAYIKKYGLPNLVHVHVPLKAGLVALLLKKKWKIPYIVSEQASHYENEAPDSFDKRSFFYRHSAKKVFRNAVKVTNVSATIGNSIQRMFRVKKVEVIPNLAETRYFYYAPPVQEEKFFCWLHVSSLHPQKNPAGLLEAFHLLDKKRMGWKLIIVGPAEASLIEVSNRLQLTGKVLFTGEVAYKDVALYMQQAHAFVLFSNHENFPCVIPEALCCGLPVVAANAGGIAEAVNASNGILVPKGDCRMLAAAMDQLMNSYQGYQRASIAANAKEKYTEQVIAQKFYDLYEAVLKGTNKS